MLSAYFNSQESIIHNYIDKRPSYFYIDFIKNKTKLAQRFLFADMKMPVVAEGQLHVAEKFKTNQFNI